MVDAVQSRAMGVAEARRMSATTQRSAGCPNRSGGQMTGTDSFCTLTVLLYLTNEDQPWDVAWDVRLGSYTILSLTRRSAASGVGSKARPSERRQLRRMLT